MPKVPDRGLIPHENPLSNSSRMFLPLIMGHGVALPNANGHPQGECYSIDTIPTAKFSSCAKKKKKAFNINKLEELCHKYQVS